MKRLKLLTVVSGVLVFMISCGGSGDGSGFIGSRTYAFDAAIDPGTLTQENNIYIYESFSEDRDESYALATADDLDSFNQTLTTNEKITLTDLDDYTYFLIRGPDCPEEFDYSAHSYSNNALTIVVDHYVRSDVACLAVEQEIYIVFKAAKSP